MKPSMVSVSRVAGPPHVGHVVFDHVGCAASGERAPSASVTSSGRRTGSSASGTG